MKIPLHEITVVGLFECEELNGEYKLTKTDGQNPRIKPWLVIQEGFNAHFAYDGQDWHPCSCPVEVWDGGGKGGFKGIICWADAVKFYGFNFLVPKEVLQAVIEKWLG